MSYHSSNSNNTSKDVDGIERTSNPKTAPKITRPGESAERIGTNNITEFLPAIFRTDSNKQFLDTTLEQLMSSGSLMAINNLIGQRHSQNKNYLTDNRTSDNYQFTPGLVNKDPNGAITKALTYDDLVNSLEFNEVNTKQHNNLFGELGSTLDLPINYDMFINYHKYFWLVDVLPPCSIKPAQNNPIDIDTIFNDVTYTTPALSTNNTLEFMNGMRIRFMPTQIDRLTQTNAVNTTFQATVSNANTLKVYKNNQLQTLTTDYTYADGTGVVTFTSAPALNDEIEIHNFYAHSTSGNYAVGDIYIVDGVNQSTGIKLTKQFTSGQIEGTYSTRNWLNHTVYSSQEPKGFEEDGTSFDFDPYDIREWRMTTRDYFVEPRWSPDQSAWARSNLWIHETVAQAVITFQGLTIGDYLSDNFRGVRPIIEFKPGIEKYNFGVNHIAYVNHLIEDTLDPATQIVGQTTYSHNTNGITTDWAMGSGYSYGDRVRVNMNGYLTYYECIKSHGDPFNPTHHENKQYWNRINDENFEDNDLILFINSSNTAYGQDKIFKVGGVTAGTGITLTEEYGPSTTNLYTNDKIVVLTGYNTSIVGDSDEKLEPYSGSEWWYNGTKWNYGQQKFHRSDSIQVQLYDKTLTKLDDGTKYPLSTFTGGDIFNYGYNSASTFDDALGFNPRYVDYGNTPGLSFDFGLNSNRYTYNVFDSTTNSNKVLDILGYYYYKMGPLYYNGWSDVRNGQKVKRHIQKTVTDPTKTINVNLGTTDYNKSTKFHFNLRGDLLEVSSYTNKKVDLISGTLPDIFMALNTNYDIGTQFPQADIEFVKWNGDPLTNITRTAGSQDTFQLQISAPTYSLFKYRRVSDPANFGIVRLYTETNPTTIEVKKNGISYSTYTLSGKMLSFTNNLVADDVYDITFTSDSDLDDDADGVFMTADTQIFNPQNKPLTTTSFGDLVSHIKEQMENIPGFTGNYFGINNYDSISKVHQFGGTIRQQPFSTELINQLEINNDTDVFGAIKFSANSYDRFKNQFKRKVEQLNNSMAQEIPVYQIVDKALEEINVGKNTDSEFANSNMAMYRDYESIDYSWTNTMTASFRLPKTVNTYDDSKNHIQVWLQEDNGSGTMVWKPLQENSEYTLTPNNITVTKNVTFGGAGVVYLHVRWYPQNSVSYIPPSAVKLGLIRPYTPETYNDGTNNVIIQHDGSIHIRQGTELFDRNSVNFNIVDSAIWDLEHRISNNLHLTNDNIRSYLDIFPNPYRPTSYTWSDVNASLLSEFNKWKSSNSIVALNSTTYYDSNDKFTWNYSSVGPGIGGWKGLYHYYFNTDRPHTHPWEILGQHTKPTWWDANYSWTDITKRSALIDALTYGHYNDPADTYKKYDKNLAIPRAVYDLTANTLVTNAGVLNDPVTANVVSSPNVAEASKDFVYGDWGPVEDDWRSSSQYKIQLFLGLMRLRPLWVTNIFFMPTQQVLLDTATIDNPHWIDNSQNQLINYSNDPKLSGTNYENSIIESVRVINGGSYTTAPVLTIYSNFGTDAKLTAYLTSGVITDVSVDNPGKAYYNKPRIVPSSGTATFEATLAKDAKKYFIGLNNAIVEFANYNGIKPNTIIERFKFNEYNPILKAGGFLNPNHQRFVLQSSQDKGATRIPEENYTSLLYTSKPTKEVFFGGIKISIDANGYKIQGYDNSNQYFTYNPPILSSRKVLVLPPDTPELLSSEEMIRYEKYEPNTQQLSYNTVLATKQDVYDFIHGYEAYLQQQGWDASWRGAATDFINWANGNNTSTPITIIPDTKTIKISDGDRGFYDTLNKRYDGVYNILDQNAKQLTTNKVLVKRELMNNDSYTEISVKNNSDSIYGVRLYKVEIEHVLAFDTTTKFDDVVYDPQLGQLHKRLTWKGSRTKNWNGKFYSPGYIIDDNSIYQNFDTTARELDQYYGLGNTLGNKQIVDTARFNHGYNKPLWSEKLNLDDDTTFEFMKGTKKYRGTRFAIDAFVRNNALFDAQADSSVHEEWAFRTSDYGDVRSRDTIEFELTKDLLTTSPQPIRFTDQEITDVLTDIVVDVDPNSPLLVTGNPGNVFTTRSPKTYLQQQNITISQEKEFANDFLTAGLPLTSEADYRSLTLEDMTFFPEDPGQKNYNFEGDWQKVLQWNNRQSYKFGDKVLHEGRSWEMLDPDGSSGLSRPQDPIIITGTITLPVIPSTGETLIIDGTTINLTKSTTTTNLNVINVVGTNDVKTSDVITHNSTLILGETSAIAQTVTFSNIVTTLQYQDIEKIGTVVNPTIQGSATATLIIDGTTVNFNDTTSTSTNIPAQAAFENAFNASWTQNTGNISAESVSRCNAIESLRNAYISANSSSAWETWLGDYFSNSNTGINITKLQTEINANPSWKVQLQALLQSDVTIINNVLNRTYTITDSIPAQDVTDTTTALSAGQYIASVANHLIANPNSVFASSTIVTTQSGSGFKLYNLTDIVQEITSAGIANITASASNNQLKITKTTSNTTQAFSLTLSVGTANSAVGFSTATETINSSANNIVTTPNLTLQQAVDQINAASVTGVTAQINQTNTNLLQINCNKATLVIGTGTANSIIGLTSGIVPAGTSTTNINVAMYNNDIISSINSANISGVTAGVSNNRIQITSINSTLVIGTGTANSVIGLTAQTYSATQSTISNVFNAIVGSDGNQVFREMTNDPNIFSIWVADNSEHGSFNQGYAVYQTMDFGMHITKACAGINPGDDAQIMIARQTNDVQAHNLVIGDYVLIRGSTTVPNIDGIHKVTGVHATNTKMFYIDEYIEQEGGVGNVYPLRNVRFKDKTTLDSALLLKQNNVWKYNFSGFRQNNNQLPILIFVDDDGSGKPAVYKYTGEWSDSVGQDSTKLVKIRTQEGQARNDLVENVKIYDAKNKSTIAQLETWDPAKGIILGFIRNEIDYIVTADIATYNYNTIDGQLETTKSWGETFVGKRWWNINTAVYLNYEQGSVSYQQNNWGRLFDGATIDVYEWTRSTVLPEQWSNLVQNGTTVNGVTASGEAYVEIIGQEKVYSWTESTYYNRRTNRTETEYYFWVKNKTSFEGLRNYNTLQLSKMLENPDSFDLSWAAASGNNLLFISNVGRYVTKNSVVQVNQIYNSNSEPLNEWTMLAEGDDSIAIPEYLHIKIRDSLAGFNNYKERFTFTTWSNATSYNQNQVVIEGTNYYISLQANNLNQQPSTDTTQSYWSRIYDYDIVAETQQDDIDVWRGQMIPDLNLHEYNRYGHLIRPRQSLYRNLVDARQNFVYKVNELLSTINIIDEIQNWENAFNHTFSRGNITYSIGFYWNWVDWTAKGYNSNIVADKTVDSPQDLIDLTDEPDGTYVRVRNVTHADGINRPEIHYYNNGTSTLVYKEKGTIELSEEMWNQNKFGHGMDASGFDLLSFDSDSSSVIGELFDKLRTNIFIGRHKIMYNKLWFTCLHEAVVQNTTDDFAFKTSYVKLNVKHPLLLTQDHFKTYDMSPVEDFFNDIKPFHTKLHNSLESVTTEEAVKIEVDEEDRKSIITFNYADHSTRTWEGQTILTGENFTSTLEHTDALDFTTPNANIEYVYDGNEFDQPHYEGWGEELYPVDYTENLSILVQTNPQGTVTAGATYSVVTQENNPRGVTFNTDGTKMFITGAQGDDVNEYTLSVGFDLTSTVTFVDSYAVTECPNPTAVKFNTDGTKMFVTGTSNSNVHEYALSTGFDVSTASFTQTLLTTVDNDNFGLDFKDDGTKMYITGNQNDKIYEYNLSSAFDISTATFNQDLSTQPHDYEPFGIEWSPDGTRLFIVGTIHNGVDLWYVSTPWDISTATHQEFYFVGGNPSGIHISPDGTKMFVVGNNSDQVKSYTLSVPYEFTTGSIATADTRTFRINMYRPDNLQTSTVIEDSKKTTTTGAVGATDTTIPVASTANYPDSGVIWIGSERIEYSAKDANNLLYATRGTLGTSAIAHNTSSVVIDNNQEIPTLNRFSDYGDNLRLAYNDSGISLTAAGTTPEHAFIRNAGQGTI